MRAQFQPQFLSQRFALLEALEKLVEEADDDGIDADALDFSPFLEPGAGLSAHVEKLRIGEIHAGLAGLLNIDFLLVNVA